MFQQTTPQEPVQRPTHEPGHSTFIRLSLLQETLQPRRNGLVERRLFGATTLSVGGAWGAATSVGWVGAVHIG
ncbi:MAG: hypothetical protein ACOYMN_20805 [Roseimicrobium sp.]